VKLDWIISCKKEEADWQRDRFRRHIKASNESGKPMIIHMRDAKEDTIRILTEEKAEAGVMHVFQKTGRLLRLH
jgi:Mg-dependent DNase